MSARRLALLVGALVALVAARPLPAQLLSPGKLALPHASLEGMSNCTQCHDLGKPGVSNAKCLACHVDLRTRIDAREGLHATTANRNCASCHKDHFGTDFQMVRFDTVGFDHKAKAGFELRLAHREEGCRSCHKPELIVDASVRTYATRHRVLDRTYLGLGTGCTDCHRTDNVHGNQFGTRTCTACHDESTWEETPRFFHDSSRYVLTGKHRTTACASCHKEVAMAGSAKPVVRYAGVRFATCTNCHADHHNGAMPQKCETCHSTEGWRLLRNRSGFEGSFDHARTDFPLRGAHGALTCATCHDMRRAPAAGIKLTWASTQVHAMYPAPIATGCLSCHLDAHDSTFVRTAGGRSCENCHNETRWLPSTYDLARHNRETYVLTGAHVVVACAQCHQPVRPGGPPQFRLPAQDCASCHKTVDPHAGQFGDRACTQCHTTETFRIAAFDHSRTRYPLDATHRTVACAKCHTVTAGPNGAPVTRYRPLETTCRACHGASTPRRP